MSKLASRIFLISPFENELTGRGTRFLHLADMLSKNGYNIEFVTSNFSHAKKIYFSDQEIKKYISQSPYKIAVIKIQGYKKNISLRRFLTNVLIGFKYFRYLYRIIQPNDVLILPSRPVELISAAVGLRLLKKCRVILDVRDIWPDMLIGVNRCVKSLFSLYCNVQLYYALKYIDHFIYVAPSFLKWINKFIAKGVERATFIPLGFDEERWKSVEYKVSFNNKCILLVFIGAFQRQLDLMPILKAILKRKNIYLYLIGDSGTGENSKKILSFIKNHNMKNVFNLGWMAPKDLVEEIKDKHIGIVPMVSSALPNKVFDYIAAYLPIISLGSGDTSKFVQEHGIGWTAPFDAEELGRLLDNLKINDIIQKKEIIKKIRNKFSVQVLYKKYIKIIDNILC